MVNYTPAYNLLKTEDMEVGAVSFKNPKLVSRLQHMYLNLGLYNISGEK